MPNPLNTANMLDISTGHLALSTRRWLGQKDVRENFGIAKRTAGYFVSTNHADRLNTQIPADLHFVLAFAKANGMAYVNFDYDADPQAFLPWYEDGNTPISTEDDDWDKKILGLDHLEWSDAGVQAPRKGCLNAEELRIERSWTSDLEDGDYDIPEGAWLGLNNLSIRICPLSDESVMITSFVRGAEMDDPSHQVNIEAPEVTKDPALE